MALDICLFRHGRTYWNAEGRYQGIADIEPDELGKHQSRAVARRCAEISPLHIYSSDLVRCAHVARLVAEATGTDVSYDQRLRERDVGTWSGKTRAEVAELHSEDIEAWMAGDEDVKPGGGESVGDVMNRVEGFIETIRSQHENGTVVVVSHAAWIRHAIQWVFGPDLPRQRIGVPSQASLTVLRMGDDGQLVLTAFNDRGHLLEVEDIDREAPAPSIY